MTMTGFASATSRVADRKARASPTVSMYRTMASVCGSSPRWSMRSPQPTSAIDPSETIVLKPTCSRRLQSRMAVMSAPLCPTNATRPRRAIVVANVAFRPDTGLMTPRQFGPMSRMPCARACSTSARSSAAPSGPTSLKPAEMTMTFRHPARPQSATRSGIVAGGVTMTASSGRSGRSLTVGCAAMPRTDRRLGFTG
jgi:hypothetical protein